ncbi:concanavalin A-like lectin/glucanase domain-containing protein [Microdochium trichocladiopsis]|uniref:chitinase n=1 Tax=Microdochium trichocladiopsis TaxID=1682393 RepID=A0A9P8Y2X4_9PEZI|nr:concanavalin A-like lectin/glucanase domain-containing protein [Microdochium trichocladiopsis]KAH7027494.1 concanavalin A-like lectin/glucanase domain-containing protein [Microdochium trichocladiopsis]
MMLSRHGLGAAVVAALSMGHAAAQTWTSCNPLTTTCPPNTGLGMTVDVDFTKGSVNSFVASGGGSVTYDPKNGATFTVTRGGDAPQLASVFYIMFGRVEMTFKAAHGAGIVSSFVLQSDCLDEIDWEWLGADPTEVQSNYFGKGITTSYNRGAFHQTPENQNSFHTYVVDWNANRIVWTVDGTVVRQLGYNDAEAGQYPQTPMQVKFGAWSGGDPSNPPGTIEWSRGPTDYSKGPFSMNVKHIKVTDYSTGSKYTYGDHSGTWQSIQADGGKVNGNLNGAGALTTTAVASSPTTAGKPSVPVGGVGGDTTAGASQYNLPPGWFMTSEGKIMPIGAAGSVVPPIAFVGVFTLMASVFGLGRFWM